MEDSRSEPQSGLGSGVAGGLVPRDRTEGPAVHMADYAGPNLLCADPSPETHTRPGPSTARMVLRHKWLIVAVFAAVSVAAIPLIWLLMVPMYQSTAIIRVRPVISRIVFKTEDNGIVPLYQSFVNTQVSLLRDPRILNRVLDNAEIQKTHWYTSEGASFFQDPLSPLERLRNALTVQPRPQTELIDVTMMAMVPLDAQKIVKAVAGEYDKYVKETAKAEDEALLQKLAAKREGLQAQIDGLIKQKLTAAKEVGAVDPDRYRSQLATDISRLETELGDARRAMDRAARRLGRLASAASRPAGAAEAVTSQPTSAGVQRRFYQDAEWLRLDAEVKRARQALDAAGCGIGPAHPRMKELETNLAFADRARREHELRLEAIGQAGPISVVPATEGRPDGDRAMLEVEKAEQNETINDLQKDINDKRRELENAGNKAIEIADYDESIRQQRELYEAVRMRREQLEVEKDATLAQIEVYPDSTVPGKPARDRRMLMTAMALAFALAAGVGAAYLRSLTDTRIHEASDVVDLVRVPFLGQVRKSLLATDPIKGDNPALLESIRMVRTALLERIRGAHSPVVLVTSPVAQSGKTSVTILLADSLAVFGKKVLVVEADVRRPSLRKRLGLDVKQGLVALLAGTAHDADPLVRVGDPGFDVLVAGDCAADFNAEVLGNGEFEACLSRWKTTYDIILLDGPPLLPVADGRMLARQADGTVMVVRASHCRRAEAMQAYGYLCASGGALLGTVLVGGRSWEDGYGYSYYGSSPLSVA